MSEMIAKTYKLTFTDNSRTVMDRLINYGYNIRDILNAGVIMFEKATNQQRGLCVMESRSSSAAELKDTLDKLKDVLKSADVSYETLSGRDSKLLEEFRRLYGPDAEINMKAEDLLKEAGMHPDCERAAAAEVVVKNAVNDAKAPTKKRGHRTA